MKKKIALKCLLLVVCIIFLFVASGCSENGPEVKNPDGNNNGNGNKEEKTEIVFSNWGDSEEKKMFEAIFDEFMKENEDITVKYLYIPHNEYITKLNAMAATKTLPDIGQMIEYNSLQWAENDMFVDVRHLYENGSIEPRLDSVTFNETENGFLGSSFITEIYTLFYDKEYTDSMGVEVPATVEDAWTWDEFVEECKKLTVDVNGNHPGDPGFDPSKVKVYAISDMPAELVALNNGGGIFNEDYTEIWLDKPETIEAFQMVADLMNVHHVAPRPASRSAIGGGNNVLLTKKVAMSYAGQYNLLWYKKYIENGSLDVGFGIGPKLDDYVVTTSGPAIVVFDQSEHKEEAMRLLEYFYETKNVMPAIRNGLWMPSEKSYYEEEDKIQEWIGDSKIHQNGYKTAVLDVARDNSVPSMFYKLSNYNEVQNVINAPLDQVWSGKKSAEEVIKNEIMPNLEKLMNDYWKERGIK